MGCSNSSMVKVAPNKVDKPGAPEPDVNGNVITNTQSKRIDSAASRDSRDSGLEDDMRSEVTSVRMQSGVSRQTISSLKPSSAKSRPVESESDILKSLRAEGLIATTTHKARSGLAFEVVDSTPAVPHRLPNRLAKLEKRKKKAKLLTQKDIQAKLEQAEIRRKEVETERLNKIHSVMVKSDVTSALEDFAARQKEVEVKTVNKVDTAAEKRQKQLRDLQEKLRAREEHAAQVRRRKLLVKKTEEKSDDLTGNETKPGAEPVTTAN